MSQSICTPNFYETFQFVANYCCFWFLKTDVRHIGILLPLSILTCSSSWAWHFASAYEISSKSANARRSYDISIFQDGGHGVGNLLPASVLMTALVYRNVENLCHEISQFAAELLLLPVSETVVRHIESLLPVSIYNCVYRLADAIISTNYDDGRHDDCE